MKILHVKLGHEMSESITPPVTTERMYYPTFHYDGKKQLKLPGSEGMMLIKYRKVSSSESENDEGEMRYSCTIEVQEIVSAKSDEDVEAPAGHDRETEDALDALAREKVKAKEKAQDSDDEY